MRNVDRNLKIGFILSMALLLAIATASFFSIRNLFKSSRLVDHSNLVIATLEKAMSVMKDAETGQRGYLLTGTKAFLEPYYGSYEKAHGAIDEFRKLTSDNSIQQSNAALIDNIVHKRLTSLKGLVEKKQLGEGISSEDLLKGKQAMDDLRVAIEHAESYEKIILNERLADLQGYTFLMPMFLVLATLAALGISTIAYFRIRNGLIERSVLYDDLQVKEQETAAANEELATLNEELVASNEEVQASNEDLLSAREDLAQLNSDLEETVTIRTAALRDRETALTIANSELKNNQGRLEQLLSDLKESEQRSSGIVAGTPFPIGVYIGREMRIALANQSIIDVWGKGQDVIGKTYFELLPELAGQAIYGQLDHVFLTGEPFHARNQRVDIVVDNRLQPFYFNYSFTTLRDTSNNIYGVLNTAAEVTDIVLAKEQVERSEQNLREMIAQAPVAMSILTGPDHVVAVANHLMLELWGKPENDVMNKTVFDALPDARGQGLEAVMKNVYETGETFYASEMPVSLIRHGQQEVVYQNFVYQAYRDADGVTAGIIAITIDVTEQVQARQKLEQSESELRQIRKKLEAELELSKQLERQKDDFIGMASHELKTPLTSLSAIIQAANIKLKTNTDPFIAQAMDKSIVQVKRMTAMINGFLNISRLEAGKIQIDKQLFDLNKLITEVLDETRLTVTSHQLIFNDNEPIMVNADREKIGSVLSNLIGNAVKYSPRDTKIEIQTSIDREKAIVKVKDEGMGISATDAEHIFDRYYRVQTSNTQHIAGFGIGLYLSAEIIKRHDGQIWVESESNAGSVFYFSLPIQVS